jgi:hypothetical protein
MAYKMEISKYLCGGQAVKTYGGIRSASAAFVKAQEANTVSGYVYKRNDGAKWTGVKIYKNTTLVATTDANGYYSFSMSDSGYITLTATPTSDGLPISVYTNAKGVDFYLYSFQEGDTTYNKYGKVNGTITNAQSAKVENAAVNVLSHHSKRFMDMGYYNNTTNSIGYYAVEDKTPAGVNIGESIIVSAGKKGVGNDVVSGEALASGQTLSVNVTIDNTKQGTVSGSLSFPTGFSSPYILGVGNFSLGSGIFVGIPTYEADSSSYSFPVKGNAEFAIYLSVWDGVSWKKSVGAALFEQTVGSGETLTKNMTLYSPPSNLSVTTAEVNGITTSTLTWEAPTGWTPDIYTVMYSGYVAYTKSTSITVPVALPTNSNEYLAVYAIKTDKAVDVGDFDIFSYSFTHFSGINAR